MITVVKEIIRPRLPSLKGKMQAKKMVIPVWAAEDISADPERIGLQGSPTKVWKIFTPEFKHKGEMIQGEPRAQVDRLISEIRRLGIV